ncbi:hypothetical protein A4G19_03710 [Pasteurellaceae bacterium Macca]|nr:hypothetical protein [Pasteurellaceae bacterium Macca]
MAKKAKSKKPQKNDRLQGVQSLQTNEAQITATGRVIADHPSNKITPAKLKAIFDDAEMGDLTTQHELFMDIEERDSSIAANIQTRKRSLLTLDWRIAEPRNATPAEEKLREEVEAFFYQFINLEDVMMDLMDAVGHGFSALEIEWQQVGDKWAIKALHPRPQSWFRLDKDDNLLLKTPSNSEGEPLQPFGWVVHCHKSRSVGLARLGLYRSLAWLYMFKHYSVHDFAEFLELYGMPIRIGKYGAGATNEEKRTLLRALAQIGHNAAGIMPEGMNVELHNVATGTSAGNNPFLQMVDWCEKSIARLILGQTLTSGADGKSSTNALGNVHNEVRRDLLISDAKQLAQTLTQQLILPYLQINVNPNIDPTRIPYFEFDTREREDLGQFAEALPKLVNVGVQIPEDWVREKLGIPDVQEGKAILKPLESEIKAPLNPEALSATIPQTGIKHATCACGCGVSLSAHTQPKGVDAQGLLDGSLDHAFTTVDFNQQLDPMIKQAVGVLLRCDSYEQASERLAELYPKLHTQQHFDYLNKALFIAELLGTSYAY